MSSTKQIPDPLVSDGQIRLGSPLHRLQAVFDDDEQGVLVGDLRDVCSQCDASDKTVAKLVKESKDKLKGERIRVSAGDVEYLTAMLVEPPAFEKPVASSPTVA